MEEDFQVGDVVELKSGSPKMTISALEEGFAICTFYDEAIHVWKLDIKLPVTILQISLKKGGISFGSRF